VATVGAVRGTKRKHKDGVRELRVYIGRNPETGNPRQISRTFHGGARAADDALRDLVDRYGDDLRYSYQGKKWYVFDTRRWRGDNVGEVPRRAISTVRAIGSQAQQHPDGDLRKALLGFAVKSESAFRIHAMVDLARHDVAVVARARWGFVSRVDVADLRLAVASVVIGYVPLRWMSAGFLSLCVSGQG